MKDNLYYFEYSLQNYDDIIDFSNPLGVLVVSKLKDIKPKELQIKNAKLIELIIAYKQLRNKQKAKEIKNSIVSEIIEIIETTEQINYSAFCSYFQVLKYSYCTYINQKKSLSKEEKIELISEILKNYIDNRHDLYMSYGYSDQILQVMSDCASARRNSKTGIEKIESIVKKYGFSKAVDYNDLTSKDKKYILPDKGASSIFNIFLRHNNISFGFREDRDGKNPDMLLKINQDIFIIEHKLTNNGGGSQNLEINEIGNFIGKEETNKYVHYISCLQGNYMKELTKNSPKNRIQINNILSNLNINKTNYFVNGKGFELLIKDLTGIV